MITDDASGSNSYRSSAFKTGLAKLAASIGPITTVGAFNVYFVQACETAEDLHVRPSRPAREENKSRARSR